MSLMQKSLLIFTALLFSICSIAQINIIKDEENLKKIYRATPEKINDLVHTKLEVKFDFAKAYLYGKEWVTLKPHFYPTDSLRLDAKGMDIKKVALFKNGQLTNLSYSYADSLNLRIELDRVYKGGETYTVFIDYTSKPNELKAKGSAAITDAKGLYFINPLGKEKDKPTQVWTQGETEASSVWFPTIDNPDQKSTEEISMTIPAKYVTLSNGTLVTKKNNADGTRTDTWKMNEPHSPYLFMMAVGDFAIVKDSYKGKEVSYYVEKPFEKIARRIFGLTPEMIGFYSSKLGVEYPWPKYAQIVARDYVSGAMENTSATLHSEYLQQNARQLADGNKYEDYIAHELFHQWFGDLVTAESWSNLTLNESFANFSETIWNEYKHGQDAGDEHNYTQMQMYLNSRSEDVPLVRFHYSDKEEMFDRVSYEKGGRILNMLRNVVGEDAFFKSLNLYLNQNKFKNAEADQLRLAFEEVTGKDLNWFWNQWYYSAGHPKLDITYGYNDAAKQATVIVNQTQEGNTFRLPVAIDVYNDGKKTRYNVWVENKTDTFNFASSTKPELINFDGDKILLAEKKENKTLDEYIYQYKHAKKYVDRREAIVYAARHKDQQLAKNLLFDALKDPYYELRERSLKNLNAQDLSAEALKTVEAIAKSDNKSTTRAAAIDVLATTNDSAYQDLYIAGTKDSSYTVVGASLIALSNINEPKALALIPSLQNDVEGPFRNKVDPTTQSRLKATVHVLEVLLKGDADFTEMSNNFTNGNLRKKSTEYRAYINYLGNVYNTDNFKKGLDQVIAFRDAASAVNPQFKAAINTQLLVLKNKKLSLKTKENSKAIDEQVKYIEDKTKDVL
jgi:aminopeptidase N